MKILTAAEYEALLLASLARLGLTGDRAAVLAARWPLDADAAVCECGGRGLDLTPADLRDFLRWKFQVDHFDDGEPLEARSVGWTPRVIDECLAWAAANGRGTPAPLVAEDPPPPALALVSLADLFQALRSDDLLTRVAAGLSLARSLGAGLALQGEHQVDVEFVSGPEISRLLGLAMCGDAAAVAALADHFTTDRASARERTAEARPGLRTT